MNKRDKFAITLAVIVIIAMFFATWFKVIPSETFSGFTWGVVLMNLLYQCLLRN